MSTGRDHAGRGSDEPPALRERLEARLEEPVARARELTQTTMALFPVRVWRRFLARNGFLLSAGISYQALFAVFAAVYLVFAIAGIWLAASPEVMAALIDLINRTIPGLIGDGGAIPQEALEQIADGSTSVLTITGVVAIVVLGWTAIGWMTYSRQAVRAIFGVPRDPRSYVLLKARDLVVALVAGAALLSAAALSAASTAAVDWVLGLIGLRQGGWSSVLAGAIGLAAVFAIDAVVLLVLFRFLANARLGFRRMLPGTLLGALGLVVLQGLGGALLGGASRNPLLSTFVVFVGMLLWFRLASIVTLVSASWVAVAVEDRGGILYRPSDAERARLEAEALVVAARVQVREASTALASARWWERRNARARLRAAQAELAEREGATPDAPSGRAPAR